MPSRALIITGMHRSGTSLTASLLQTAGLYLGDRLNPPLPGNVRGHFEDLDFVRFHEAVLTDARRSPDGFEPAAPDIRPSPNHLQRARELVAARLRYGVPWGWKDPRTVLFLDFWHRQLPDAGFLFIVRKPWQVVESLFRRGDVRSRLAGDAVAPARIWLSYNRRIRDFAREHPDRVLVREVSQVAHDPAGLCRDVKERFGIALLEPKPLYEPGLLSDGDGAIRRCLVELAAPGTLEVYAELCRLAGHGAGDDRAADRPGGVDGDLVVPAFEEWLAVCGRPSERPETGRLPPPR